MDLLAEFEGSEWNGWWLALTPALSPRERGIHSLRLDGLTVAGFTTSNGRVQKGGAMLLPLPGGEGRGEGGRGTDFMAGCLAPQRRWKTF